MWGCRWILLCRCRWGSLTSTVLYSLGNHLGCRASHNHSSGQRCMTPHRLCHRSIRIYLCHVFSLGRMFRSMCLLGISKHLCLQTGYLKRGHHRCTIGYLPKLTSLVSYCPSQTLPRTYSFHQGMSPPLLHEEYCSQTSPHTSLDCSHLPLFLKLSYQKPLLSNNPHSN